MANTLTRSVGFKVAFIILVLCLVLQLLGYFTQSWIVVSFSGMYKYNSRYGLWKVCTEIGSEDGCVNMDVNDKLLNEWCFTSSAIRHTLKHDCVLVNRQFSSDSFRGVQAFETLGLAFLILAILSTFALLFCTSNACLDRLKLVFTFISGVSIFTGVGWHCGLFGFHDLGYSFFLCLSAGAGTTGAFLIFCCCDKVPAEQQQGYILQSGALPLEQYPPQVGYGQQPTGYNVQPQGQDTQIQPNQQIDPSAPPPSYNELEKSGAL